MNKKYISIAVLLLLLPLVAGAQALKGSYFMDNSVNRHRMNPAFTPRSNYIQLPVIGNTSMTFGTNLGLESFLYPKDGQLLTFLHQDVSVDEFQKTFPKYPNFDTEFSTNVLSFGFYNKKKAFWTFDVDMRANCDVDLPGDLFLFMKKGTGTSGETFNIGNINMYSSAAVQASLGYSRDIFKGLRVGVKARAIAPLAYTAINLEKVQLTTGSDKWNITTEGHAYTAMRGLQLTMEDVNSTPALSFDTQEMLNNKALAGFGYSFDLGFEYKLELKGLFNGIRVSAAVTDLGQIHYSKDAVSAFKSGGSVDWPGFQNLSLENIDVETSINELMDNAKNLVSLEQEGVGIALTRSTMPRVYAGVEVPFFFNRMSVGLLYSARKSHSYLREELTASYNLKMFKWLAVGANYSLLNAKGAAGGILQFTPKFGPSFYIGCDYFPLEWVEAPMFDDILGSTGTIIPMAYKLNLNFGLTFALGSKHGR